MKIYKLKKYDNMRQFLHRQKIENASSLAHFLIEKFVNAKCPTHWQRISAKEIKEKNIYPSKSYSTFKEWRDAMIKNGILICMATMGEREEKDALYKANFFKYGHKIKKYIEAELQITIFEKIDSKADNTRVEKIEEDINELQNLKQDVQKLKDDVQGLTALVLKAIPPDTAERRKIVEENFHDREKCIELLNNFHGSQKDENVN